MNMEKMRRDVPTQFIGEHQTKYGAREFHRERCNIAGVEWVPDIIKMQGNGESGMGMPGPEPHSIKLHFETLMHRQKYCRFEKATEKSYYLGPESVFTERKRRFKRQFVLIESLCGFLSPKI